MAERVTESFSFSGGTVDRAGKYPVVRGVLLCGRESAWKRRYLAEAFTGDKVKVYENRPVYFDHTGDKSARRFRDKVGWVENPRHNSDGLPVGDIGVNPKADGAEAFLWAAEHKPDFCSMSHVADIETVGAADGWREVKECKYVDSVDIVTSGATTKTLFSEGKPVPQTVKEYANKLAARCSVEQLLKLRELVKEDFAGDAAMPSDAPPPDADATEPDDGIDSAFLAVATKELQECMEAKGDPAKLKRCLGRLKKLLMTHGELSTDDVKDEGGEGDGDGDEGGEKGDAKEGKPAGIDPWALMDECAKEGFTPSATQLKALKGMGEPADRTAFIRECKGLAANTSPKSKGRESVAEGKDGKGEVSGVEEARQVMAGLAKEVRGSK